jgi:hypothetical protein
MEKVASIRGDLHPSYLIGCLLLSHYLLPTTARLTCHEGYFRCTAIAVDSLVTTHACNRHDSRPCATSPDDENDKPDIREIGRCTDLCRLTTCAQRNGDQTIEQDGHRLCTCYGVVSSSCLYLLASMSPSGSFAPDSGTQALALSRLPSRRPLGPRAVHSH